MQPREPVAPAGVAAITPKVELPTDTPERQRRLALAKWITDPANPLTARVMVNRLWHYHFGTGIVATPGDFGHKGVPPTHPELLDWLASEFVAHGWSVKHIQRLIVTSATYRQSSKISDFGLRIANYQNPQSEIRNPQLGPFNRPSVSDSLSTQRTASCIPRAAIVG
jgi:hypothetical protein